MDLESEYNAKFTDLCNKIPNDKFIFEITKLCGYGEFLIVLISITPFSKSSNS